MKGQPILLRCFVSDVSKVWNLITIIYFDSWLTSVNSDIVTTFPSVTDAYRRLCEDGPISIVGEFFVRLSLCLCPLLGTLLWLFVCSLYAISLLLFCVKVALFLSDLFNLSSILLSQTFGICCQCRSKTDPLNLRFSYGVFTCFPEKWKIDGGCTRSRTWKCSTFRDLWYHCEAEA